MEFAGEEDVGEFGVGVGVCFWFPGVGEGGIEGLEGIVAWVWDPAVGYGRYLMRHLSAVCHRMARIYIH